MGEQIQEPVETHMAERDMSRLELAVGEPPIGKGLDGNSSGLKDMSEESQAVRSNSTFESFEGEDTENTVGAEDELAAQEVEDQVRALQIQLAVEKAKCKTLKRKLRQ